MNLMVPVDADTSSLLMALSASLDVPPAFIVSKALECGLVSFSGLASCLVETDENVKRNKRTACVDCSDFYEQLLQTLLPGCRCRFKIVRADIDDIPVYLAVDSAADMVLSLQCFAPMDGLQIDLQIDAQNMITGWEVVLSD